MSVTPRALRSPSGTQDHDGLVLCDTAPYRNCSSTSASCQFSNFGGNNQKYDTPYLITVAYRDVDRIYTPRDFPATCETIGYQAEPAGCVRNGGSVERARRYLERVPPAITGQHGDLHTFRVCCRLVRGFALDDDEAFVVLAAWNARCQPPWTDADLRDKVRRARQYGREPIGGLL